MEKIIINKDEFIKRVLYLKNVQSVTDKYFKDLKSHGIRPIVDNSPIAMMVMAHSLLGYVSCIYPTFKTFRIIDDYIHGEIDSEEELYKQVLESSDEIKSKENITFSAKEIFEVVLDRLKRFSYVDTATADMFQSLGLTCYTGYYCASYLLEDCAELLCYLIGASFENYDTTCLDMINNYCIGYWKGVSARDVYNEIIEYYSEESEDNEE